VEPDPAARRAAASDGILVSASLHDLSDERFDAVTLSHVLEHVHRPSNLLETLAKKMNAHGHLYIDTPNFDAVGHRLYGRHWRGLEAPRHLVLFNRSALQRTLERAGFANIRFHECPGALQFTQLQSRRIAIGADPYDEEAGPTGAAPGEADYRAALSGTNAEFLRVTASRV
jgi:hypothetical protein